MVTTDEVLQILKHVIDPELGINIVDLGLVYDVTVEDDYVDIKMTMTSPACPLYRYLTEQAEMCLRRSLLDLRAVTIELVWEPEWNPMMMSWEAAVLLGE
jgi:metal-sulfur cluster biosynthetic enzyme